MKELKGDKYIYLTMGYLMAKNNGGNISIGYDNNCFGGYHYQRTFSISNYNDEIVLSERKSSPSFADYSRRFKVVEECSRIKVYEIIDEAGDNLSKQWLH